MECFYEGRYEVDSRALDYFNCCRPSALLGFLQEAATAAAVELHLSRGEMLDKYHVFWMLARIWYRLDRPLRWGDVLTVRTWHRGGKGASMYRDFDLYVDGVRIGEAVSIWVLADADTHALMKLSRVEEFTGTSGGALCKDRLLYKLRLPDALPLADRRALHYSDADMNRHVNNTRYADFACDALHLETLEREVFVSSLQIGYLSECRPGEELTLCAGAEEGQYFVHGTGPDGASRFDAALTLETL